MRFGRRTFLTGTLAITAIPRRSVVHAYQVANSDCSPVNPVPEAQLIYFDSSGLLVQRDCDGGDTAQREGWMWLGIWLRERLRDPWTITPPLPFKKALQLLEPQGDGDFIRHPVKWNDPKDFSRDQSIPIIAATGIWGEMQPLSRMWSNVKKRVYKFQNDDLCAPEHVNLFRRSLGERPQTIGDLQLVGSSAVRCALGRDMDDVGDDLNHIVSLMIAKFRRPTALVDLAIRIYATRRPITYGSYLGSYRQHYGTAFDTPAALMIERMKAGIAAKWKRDPDVPNVLGALRWYFRAESGGSPALAELYAPVVRRWLT